MTCWHSNQLIHTLQKKNYAANILDGLAYHEMQLSNLIKQDIYDIYLITETLNHAQKTEFSTDTSKYDMFNSPSSSHLKGVSIIVKKKSPGETYAIVIRFRHLRGRVWVYSRKSDQTMLQWWDVFNIYKNNSKQFYL